MKLKNLIPMPKKKYVSDIAFAILSGATNKNLSASKEKLEDLMKIRNKAIEECGNISVPCASVDDVKHFIYIKRSNAMLLNKLASEKNFLAGRNVEKMIVVHDYIAKAITDKYHLIPKETP